MADGHLAFVCAMPMELTPLARDLELNETSEGGRTVHRGRLGDREVVAIVTGMGPELAARGIEALLDVFAVDHVLVVGITGALENETPIGTVVLPEIVVDSASGREHRHVPIGDAAHEGRMLTTHGLTTELDVLAALRDEGVVSLDMETAAIAHACDRRGVPWSVFRAISDRPSDGIDAEMFATSNQDGTPNPGAAAAYFAKHPEKAELLVQLGENATLATERAAAAAIEAAHTL